jgi:hypothetical protein
MGTGLRRRKAPVTGLLVAALVALVTGCGDGAAGGRTPGDEVPEAAAGDSPVAPVAEPIERAAERRIAIEIEGMREELRFLLYRSPAGFPLPFSTYIPADMIAEAVSAGEADAIRFIAAFGGVRNEGAAVHLIVHRAGAGEAEAVSVLRALAAGLGTELTEASAEESFDWSVRDFRSVALPGRPDAVEGTMAVGRRGDRYFSLVIHHPAEYGDGFGPRARQILREWRWEDTGEALLERERGRNGRA